MKKELTILSIYENVTDACIALRDFCTGGGIDKNTSSEFELCLTEALNNVIKHAYKGDHTKKIDLLYSLTDNELEIVVEDTGIARTNIKEPVLNFDPDDINSLPEGGMGLYIIKNLMDSAEYSRVGDKNIFKMKKLL